MSATVPDSGKSEDRDGRVDADPMPVSDTQPPVETLLPNMEEVAASMCSDVPQTYSSVVHDSLSLNLPSDDYGSVSRRQCVCPSAAVPVVGCPLRFEFLESYFRRRKCIFKRRPSP